MDNKAKPLTNMIEEMIANNKKIAKNSMEKASFDQPDLESDATNEKPTYKQHLSFRSK